MYRSTHHTIVRALLVTAIAAASVACAPASVPPAERSAEPSGERTAPSRTLVIALGSEPGSVAVRSLIQSGSGRQLPVKLFNAQLAQLDHRGQPVAQLAEALPQLNTDTWRVFPDGRMETTYRLKPNLTWHDGAPLTAEDFAFSWRVFSNPDAGGAGSPPLAAMEEVRAADQRTVVVRWNSPYPDADSLAARDREFPPLPRHILADALDSGGGITTFGNHPYWSREFVGAGAYRIDRWEPGSFIEAAAFDGYALGRPKIARMKLMFISDSNTLVANLLAGEVQLAADLGDVGREQFQTLKREWEGRGAGRVLREPGQWGATHFQLRPELATPRALLDPRVRKALAHAVDKAALNGALYDGEGTLADSMIPSRSQFGPEAEKSVVRYAYDLRRSDQLMGDAGFRKGPGNTYASQSGERFATELKTNAGPDSEAELLIMANGWREAGFDVQESVLPSALTRNAEVRATFPSMFTYTTTAGEPALIEYVNARVPSPENRWLGGNRAAWTDPNYERLVAALNQTLDRSERARQVAQMVAIFTEALPVNSLFFRPSTAAYVSSLVGPGPVATETNMAWNAYAWEFR